MPAAKTNTKATKATKKRTEVEVERECMRDAIKDDRKSDLIIIAVAKEEVCAYLAKKYRRRWWHVGSPNVIPVTPIDVPVAMRQACKLAGSRKTLQVLVSSQITYLALRKPSTLPAIVSPLLASRYGDENGSFRTENTTSIRWSTPKSLKPVANSNNEARPVFDTLIEIWNVAKYED
ncbi:hypothetical protein BDV32DRAFT_146869 [Aspergillus pseudonomiae]|nr:hypothetical protein BDV32DRAFT_146869 [Aspergillus pseudonomiae]